MSQMARAGWRIVVLVALLAGSTLGAGSAAAATRSPHCVVPRSRTVLSSRLVRVYAVGSHYERRFYGCLRRVGRPVFLGSRDESNPEDSSREVFQRSALTGTWVAWSEVAYDRYGNDTGDAQLMAADLRTRRKLRVPLSTDIQPFPDALEVSAHGTLAWLQRDTAPSYGTSDLFTVLPPLGGRPAVALLDNDGVTIVRGHGDGIFSAPVRAVTLHTLRPPTPADLDGDGVADLVLVAKGGVAIAPGRADGTFGPLQTLPVADNGEDVLGVAIGDFDRDGHPDIAANEFAPPGKTGGHLLVFRGRGGFAFSPPVAAPLDGSSVAFPIVADFDGDGILDVMPEPEELMHGNGDGTLSAPAKVSGVSNPSGTDLNLVGIPDLVAVSAKRDIIGESAGISVQLGRGGGQFTPPVTYDGPPTAFAVGDVSGDGIPDIVTALSTKRGVGVQAFVLRGRGDGTFAKPKLPRDDQDGIAAISLADVNGDGKLDIVTNAFAAWTAGDFPDSLHLPRGFTVLPNRGDGTFVAAKATYDVDAFGPGEHTPHELIHAAGVDRRSLRFHGAQLTWKAGGKRASARVR